MDILLKGDDDDDDNNNNNNGILTKYLKNNLEALPSKHSI
jgi:hypothetical protein